MHALHSTQRTIPMNFKTLALAAGTALVIAGTLVVSAQAQTPQETTIRKLLTERFGEALKVDEVSPAPMPGLYEVRVGTDLFYTDGEAAFLIVGGQIVDTKNRRNLTEERLKKLTAIDFASLPLKDAIVWKTGTGKRRIAVFGDPNCGYCKRFEQELTKVKDLTVYTFLMPILSPDSTEKSNAIWCAKNPTAAWRDWMIDGVAPPAAPKACDSPVERNIALGRKYRINGTPAIVFEDGLRVPGMLNAAQLEKQLVASSKP
jgi:thiol:disulfide interchange protein DsbC